MRSNILYVICLDGIPVRSSKRKDTYTSLPKAKGYAKSRFNCMHLNRVSIIPYGPVGDPVTLTFQDYKESCSWLRGDNCYYRGVDGGLVCHVVNCPRIPRT